MSVNNNRERRLSLSSGSPSVGEELMLPIGRRGQSAEKEDSNALLPIVSRTSQQYLKQASSEGNRVLGSLP